MTYPYAVHLTIGSYNWIRTLGDAPSLPEILDNLTVGWQFPDTDLWPTQPEPVTASFSLLAASAADLAGIDIGTRVHLQVYAGATNSVGIDSPTVRLAGRVTDLDGRARTFRNPDTDLPVEGWQLDVQCADYTADAAEITVYAENMNLHGDSGFYDDPHGRLLYLTAPFGSALGNPITANPTGPTSPPQGDTVAGAIDFGDYLAGADAGQIEPLILAISEAADTTAANKIYGPATLAETFDRYLSIWPNSGGANPSNINSVPGALYAQQGWRRPIYRAKLDADGLPLAAPPWRLEWVSRRNLSTTTRSTLPLKFAAHDGVYGPVKGAPSPAKAKDSSLLLSAAVVDVGAVWTRSKQTEPNRVVVTTGVQDQAQVQWRTVTRSDARPGDSVVTATMDSCTMLDPSTVGFLADMYNGDDEQTAATQWALGEITWYASRDASWPRNVSLFPDAELWLGHSTPVVLEGIPTTQKPLTARYVGGAVKSAQFSIARGEFQFDLQLYPRIPRPAANGGAITCADLAASAYSAVKFNQLDTASSITYRLVHAIALD